MKPLSLTRPHLIVMVGISGAGKSQFAAQFADVFKAPFVSRDAVLGQLSTKLTTDRDQLKTANRVTEFFLNQLLKTGQTIVFDGASDSRAERAQLSKVAKEAGYESLFVWVQTDPAEAKRRAVKLNKAKSVTPEEYEASLSRFYVPTANENVVVISGKHTFASQLKIVLKRLSGNRAEAVAHTNVPPRTGRNIIIR